MNNIDFEKLVLDAIDDLPLDFKERMENIDIIIENKSSLGSHKKPNRSGAILGLYHGIPLSKRTHMYGMVMPDKITIFKENIENACKNDMEIKKMIEHTIIHEFAHHFGISDDRLKELGVY